MRTHVSRADKNLHVVFWTRDDVAGRKGGLFG